jgi:hypothetical protein
MSVYGLVENNVCANVVVADSDWAGLAEGNWILSEPTNVAWIGATVVDGKFEVIPKPINPFAEDAPE